MKPLLNRRLSSQKVARLFIFTVFFLLTVSLGLAAETRDFGEAQRDGHTKILTFDNGMTMTIPPSSSRELAISATRATREDNGDMIFEGNVEVKFEGNNGETVCVKTDRLTITREPSRIEL